MRGRPGDPDPVACIARILLERGLDAFVERNLPPQADAGAVVVRLTKGVSVWGRRGSVSEWHWIGEGSFIQIHRTQYITGAEAAVDTHRTREGRVVVDIAGARVWKSAGPGDGSDRRSRCPGRLQQIGRAHV